MNVSELLEIKTIEFLPATPAGKFTCRINQALVLGALSGTIPELLNTLSHEFWDDEIIKLQHKKYAALNKLNCIKEKATLTEIEDLLSQGLNFEVCWLGLTLVLIREKR